MNSSYYDIKDKEDKEQIDKWCAKLIWKKTATDSKGLADVEFSGEAFTIY